MMSPKNDELDDLIWLVMRNFDGEASEDEAALLEQYLTQSSEARRIYWRLASDELALRSQAEAKRTPAGGKHGGMLLGVRRKVFSTRPWAWLLAASLLVAASLGVVSLRHASDPGSMVPVADLKRVSDAQWEGDNVPREGEALVPGTYLLGRGIVELQFHSGVSAVIEGSASWELISPTEVRLNRGRMVTNVPPQASGFKVHTDNTSVVDLGTRCGIHVGKNKRTEVHVFEGLVEVHSELPGGWNKHRLSTGQANLIDARENGTVLSSIAIRPDEFVHQLLPPVVVDPPGQRSKMVDDFADGLVTADNQAFFPLSKAGGSLAEGAVDPADYTVDPADYAAFGDTFSLTESGGALRGCVPADSLDPQFTVPFPEAVDVSEYPFLRVRYLTSLNQSVAIYYFHRPAMAADGSRCVFEPVQQARANSHREIRHWFNSEALLPGLIINAIRFDPALIVRAAEEGPFLLDYICVDRYPTAGIAEFDLDNEKDMGGWSCIGVEKPEIGGGVLRGTTLTPEAKVSHVRQIINAKDWTAIELRLKLSPQAGDARLGWGKPGSDVSFGRSVPLPNPGDGEFHTYLIMLKPHHGWTETINKITVWFGQRSGCEFELDYIRLLVM